ncbi:MAG: TIGR00282 family metallophosphoesterase [Deltaproteobacteria bacterium]|nr:TIGR00282 family metallophosphoesterase [Deltaproteobacteria bacterium]MBW2071723.1 TIGR00282 family metallophosphoesterase [Deltaproteobacteria bacterium]
MEERSGQLIRVLFVGDIVGKSGRRVVEKLLPRIIGGQQVDLVVANAENAAGGVGLTPKVAEQLLNAGIDVLTSGNHIWKKKEIESYLDGTDRVLRPANYPPGAPGRGYCIVETAAGLPVAVLNLEGRVFMKPVDCPFRTADLLIGGLQEEAAVLLVDFHAEATSEKLALAWYLDGRVSAVVGTHTHVQTADERILPEGTGYITDVGMTGPTDSVLGVRKEDAIAQLISQRPTKFNLARAGQQLQAVLLDVASASGRTESITRICKAVE